MKERELQIREAYRGDSSKKRVLVTGHTGFKGTWLLGMLQELGCDVIGYALDPKPQEEEKKSLIKHVVNSFTTKSSGTWGKADKDLAAKVRGSK